VPLPIFPVETGTPGDGQLVAVYGGTPAALEVFGGLIHVAVAIETYPQPGATVPVYGGHLAEPRTSDGLTLWIRGSLLLDAHGQPTTADYADVLSKWQSLSARLRSMDYELFVYYHPDPPVTYRKYRGLRTVELRCQWNNPVTLSYTLAAVSSDRTLYTTAPGV